MARCGLCLGYVAASYIGWLQAFSWTDLTQQLFAVVAEYWLWASEPKEGELKLMQLVLKI